MAFKISGKIDGLGPLLKSLEAIDSKMRKKALRGAVNEASKIITKAAKARVPRRLGLLKKSLGRKVKLYRKSGVAVAIIGPRTGFKQAVGTISRGPNKGKTKYADPAKYAHLVEYGTGPRRSYPKAIKSRLAKRALAALGAGKSTGRMAAKPFMRPALSESKGACQAAMAAVIAEAIGA